MTIFEALERVDGLKFNTYSREEKIRWLAEVEGNIACQILHQDQFVFDADTPEETMLLAPAPFDNIYLRWLEAQIDYHNGEYEKFNASILLYNSAWEALANYIQRNARGKNCRFVF